MLTIQKINMGTLIDHLHHFELYEFGLSYIVFNGKTKAILDTFHTLQAAKENLLKHFMHYIEECNRSMQHTIKPTFDKPTLFV